MNLNEKVAMFGMAVCKSMTNDSIKVRKEVLFQLMESHSKLAQAEYERNPTYNDSHFSALAEHKIIGELTPAQITEYFKFVDRES